MLHILIGAGAVALAGVLLEGCGGGDTGGSRDAAVPQDRTERPDIADVFTPPPPPADVAPPPPPRFILERVSVGPNGAQADRGSGVLSPSGSRRPSINADGRFVAFESWETVLTSGDTNGRNDVFLADRQTRRVERVTAGTGLDQDLQHETITNAAGAAFVSADGRSVAYHTWGNLILSTRGGIAGRVYVDHSSISLQGSSTYNWDSNPSISSGIRGNFGAFSSYRRGCTSSAGDCNDPQQIRVWGVGINSSNGDPSISVSQSPAGGAANRDCVLPSVNAARGIVTFTSGATNLIPGITGVQIYLTSTGGDRRYELVSRNQAGTAGNGDCGRSVVSGNGNFVAFSSAASNLVSGDTNNTSDVFVRDLSGRTIERVSVGEGGVQANGSSYNASITADGRFVAFESNASNLVPGDTNGVSDIFVYDREEERIRRVSVGEGGTQTNAASGTPSISADGHFVAYASDARNLVINDRNNATDVFVVGIDYLFR